MTILDAGNRWFFKHRGDLFKTYLAACKTADSLNLLIMAGEPSLHPCTCTATESAHTMHPCSFCRNWTFCDDLSTLDHSPDRYCSGCQDRDNIREDQLEEDAHFANSEDDIVRRSMQSGLKGELGRRYLKKEERAAKRAVLEPLCFASTELTSKNKDGSWIDAYTGQPIDFDRYFIAKKSMKYNMFTTIRYPFMPSVDAINQVHHSRAHTSATHQEILH